ncbi:PAS domain S-box protein [Piscinibacter sakaiensis]|uniref:PAS domain-containing sensor histidine kinase n=1 Tax=Piscinibacter sakaiensis TaxID=1547922 RepID=UPI003AB0F83A
MAGTREMPETATAEVTGAAVNELIRLQWQSPFPAWLQDHRFRLVDVNPALLAFLGFPRERLIGRDPVDFQPPEDHAQIRAARKRQAEETAGDAVAQLVEQRMLDAQGRERWARISCRSLHDDAGQVFYLSMLQDTTAEHVARERADRSARELDDWFVLSPFGMVLYDEAGLLVRTNPAFEQLIGQLPMTLDDAPASLQHLLAWDDRIRPGKGRQRLPELQPGGPPLVSQGWLALGDGSQRHLRATVRCYRTFDGEQRFMAVVEDRSAEEERDLAQVQIGALMDTAGVGLATFQESSGWVRQRARPSRAAPGGGASAGKAAKPLSAALQSINRDIVLPESLPEYERLQHALRHAQQAEVRYAIRHPELGNRWLLTRVEPATLASGKRTTSVVTLDITEQQLTLARSEQLLREVSTILESSAAGIAYVRGAVLVRCNRRFEAMLGLRRGRIAGSSVHDIFARQPQARRILEDTMKALAAGKRFETEFEVAPEHERLPRKWYALSVRRTGAPGEQTEVIAVLSDITRLKTQQAELERLARDRELMFSLSEVGIAFVRHGCIQRANQALAQLTGRTVEELLLSPLEILFADSAAYQRESGVEQAALRQHGRWVGERQLRRVDGRLIWVQVSLRLVREGDPGSGMIAAYVNVDDRHRAEQVVALQAERTRAILDSVLVGIVTVGPRGIEWMNRSARRMFGGDLVDFLNQSIATVATPDPDHPFRQTHYLNELVEGEAETFECQVKARDGRQFWIVGNVVATGRDATGRQLTYALLDVERRRMAEARMSQAQASLQRVIEAAPLAISLRDARTLKILQVNQTAALSVGRSPNELIGLEPEQIFPPTIAAQRRADMVQALGSAEVTQREYRVERAGEAQVWDARYLPLATVAGQAPSQLLMVATDVTEQRAAQQAKFDAAISQREMLVKEVHHRIKNNLQGVAGLLQQIAQRKPEVAPAISEVVAQVQAIAQVYGLQVGVSGPLRVKALVESITASVQRTFGCQMELAIVGDSPQSWALPEAESIPVALTINELLTNAVKHSAGLARVDCRLEAGEGEVRIVISNLGRLPEGFQLSRFPGGVSGLGLVRALLPRRSAVFTLEQHRDEVRATVALVPPGVTRLD